jgi:hypothetical protein
VILCCLTHDEAEILEKCCIEPNLRRKLQRQIAADLLPCDEQPHTVIFEDHGDGLHMAAVAYFTPEAAEKAAAKWWAEVVADLERAEAMMPLLVP